MRHVTQHRSSPDGDALDLWEAQDKLLLQLFDQWDSPSISQWTTARSASCSSNTPPCGKSRRSCRRRSRSPRRR